MSEGEQIARNYLSPKRVFFDASPRDRERRVTEDEDIFTIDAITARHKVVILPSAARTHTSNAVRDSLSERLIARKGARPPIGKEESVSGVNMLPTSVGSDWARGLALVQGYTAREAPPPRTTSMEWAPEGRCTAPSAQRGEIQGKISLTQNCPGYIHLRLAHPWEALKRN
ncbi:hypothetical protein B0H13DRAFT_1885472 [Mycena leptocephala]|nr:hypothetical protein B0H13DRAFT_1885472 [Mycena leptocephala]